MATLIDNNLIDVVVSGASPSVEQEDSLWYKDAIIYELHVKAFFDSNNDGVGDFPGLIRKLDYLQDLGVTVLWLLPFYPSPMKDDGYDIADYRNVEPSYGTRADFRQFVREAHRRGLRVITELVINHTSDQHPWFQAARRALPGTFKRSFYVWSDTDKKYSSTRIIFTDTETSNWTWDPVAKAYYWHRFFSHQPDVNFDNPSVLRALIRIMRFWLDLGVDGLRLDAIPYLCEREGTNNENLPETHEVIKQIRAVIDAHYKDRMLLAEANQWPEDVRDYFGEGNECHMAYHFPLMPRMYMAIAQEDRHPIVEIMQQTPDIPDSCQWAIFLRNHDELTLEMVTSKERDYMYQMYAADPRARINLGIRRRLAPLMENDIERIKLMNALLLSMPGSPIIYYGDEIGMGDNIYLGDRNGVRTPMQWSPDRNAGFSYADPQRLYLPPIMDPIYGYEAVNVEAQSRDPSSLLNWMRRVLAIRKSYKAFGRGTLTFLRPGNRKVLAYLREYKNETILVVTNLARSAQPVELDLSRYKGRVPVELMGRTPFPAIGDLPYLFTLSGHGFYWFRLAERQEVPAWHEERMPRDDLPILVFFDGWSSIFRDRVVPWRIAMAEKVRFQLEEEVLPHFVASQRWYPANKVPPRRVVLVDHAELTVNDDTWLLGVFRLEGADASTMCFLPISLVWENGDDERMRAVSGLAAAKVRQQANVGFIGDAFADIAFCRGLVQSIGANESHECSNGRIVFWPTPAFERISNEILTELPVRPPGVQGDSTTVALGQRLFIKGYRHLHSGINLDVEMGRFLVDIVGFSHCAPVNGVVEYIATDGTRTTLALLQDYIENQGDGWTYTMEYLTRFFDQYGPGAAVPGAAEEVHGAYLALIHTLGTRTGEFHRALSQKTGNPAFDPEPFETSDLAAWANGLSELVESTLALFNGQRTSSSGAITQDEVSLLVKQKPQLLERIRSRSPAVVDALKTRYHGDYELSQVLVAQNDFMIIDFEGESRYTSMMRREKKHLPIKDVAAMLGSFEQALYVSLRSVSPEKQEDSVALQSIGQAWLTQVQRTFLAAYHDATEGSALYASWQEMLDVLDLFMVENALYQLRAGNSMDHEATVTSLHILLAFCRIDSAGNSTDLSV